MCDHLSVVIHVPAQPVLSKDSCAQSGPGTLGQAGQHIRSRETESGICK